MSDIKFIFYDSVEIDNVVFDNKIDSLCQASYRIDANHLLVHYSSSCKDLYENLAPLIEGKYIIIFDININEYYGYHNSSLWKWLKGQFSVLTNQDS